MPRINLPPGCAGFSDGDTKYIAERGPGSFVNIDDDRQLKKLASQDYSAAGLVDAGPEKYFIHGRAKGRWCTRCSFLGHSWMNTCNKCGQETIPESEMERPKVTLDGWRP